METTLQPYIESGLVTRVWNPMNESYRVVAPQTQSCHIQGATGVAALLRFGFSTEYFANMDLEEFLPSLQAMWCVHRCHYTDSPPVFHYRNATEKHSRRDKEMVFQSTQFGRGKMEAAGHVIV